MVDNWIACIYSELHIQDTVSIFSESLVKGNSEISRQWGYQYGSVSFDILFSLCVNQNLQVDHFLFAWKKNLFNISRSSDVLAMNPLSFCLRMYLYHLHFWNIFYLKILDEVSFFSSSQISIVFYYNCLFYLADFVIFFFFGLAAFKNFFNHLFLIIQLLFKLAWCSLYYFCLGLLKFLILWF